jgi:hypothetical protein
MTTGAYVWDEWRMISEKIESAIEMDGDVVVVRSASSTRFACAYKPLANASFGQARKAARLQVAVYECESSGGIEWALEDTIQLPVFSVPSSIDTAAPNGACEPAIISPVDDMLSAVQHDRTHSHLLARIPSIPRAASSDEQRFSTLSRGNSLQQTAVAASTAAAGIHVDWMSTEDGAHLLTVAHATRIYMYAPVCEDDLAQQNVSAMLKENAIETGQPGGGGGGGGATGNAPQPIRQTQMLRQASSIAPQTHRTVQQTRYVCLRMVDLVSARAHEWVEVEV